jgi:thiamine biosynthesis lipoprotein
MAGDRHWEGTALGADARISLQGFPAAEADALLALCRAEIARLEAVFSLHDPASVLSRLNREGRLDAAPAGMLELIGIAQRIHTLSGGAFDPSVQPLWELYAAHFRDRAAASTGPSAAAVEAALAQTGIRRIAVSGRSIALAPGMSLTLNGIAQGYITDRVTDILRAGGARHVLVDLGEFRALGPKRDGHPWRIGLRDAARPWRLAGSVPLAGRALATSGGYGTPFDASGRHHHLFDPRTGQSARHYLSASVVAPAATEADALSTAFYVMDRQSVVAALDGMPASVSSASTAPFSWRAPGPAPGPPFEPPAPGMTSRAPAPMLPHPPLKPLPLKRRP